MSSRNALTCTQSIIRQAPLRSVTRTIEHKD